MGDQEKPVSLASKKMKNAHLGFLFFLGSTLRLIVHNEKWLISYLEEGPLIVPDLLSYRSAKEVAFLLSKDVNPHNFQSCIPVSI